MHVVLILPFLNKPVIIFALIEYKLNILVLYVTNISNFYMFYFLDAKMGFVLWSFHQYFHFKLVKKFQILRGYCETKTLRLNLNLIPKVLYVLITSHTSKNLENNDNVTNNVNTTKTFGNFYILFSTRDWSKLKEQLRITINLKMKLNLLPHCFVH